MAIANHGDSVIQALGRAKNFRVDSAAVQLEAEVRGVNANRDGSNGAGSSLQFVLAVTNLDDLGEGGADGVLVESAGVVPGLVRVGGLSVDSTVVDDALNAGRGEATVASLVVAMGVTVDKLLLAQRNQVTSLLEVSTLHSGNRAESPARSALALILDGSHVAIISPVLGIWHADIFMDCLGLGHVFRSYESVVLVDKLLVGHVGKLVDSTVKV